MARHIRDVHNDDVTKFRENPGADDDEQEEAEAEEASGDDDDDDSREKSVEKKTKTKKFRKITLKSFLDVKISSDCSKRFHVRD